MRKAGPLYLVLLFYFFGLFVYNLCSAKINLMESTNSGCQIELIVSDYYLDTMAVNDKQYLQLQIDEGISIGNPGDPDLPACVCFVGIPAEGNVRASLVNYSVRSIESVQVIPVPESVREKNFSRLHYFEGSTYQSNSFIPTTKFKVESPGFLGHQRVVKIVFYPFHYRAKSKSLQFYSTMKIQIDFEKSALSKENTIKAGLRADLSGLILNAPQTKTWEPSQSVFKQTESRLQTGAWYKIPIAGSDEGIYQVKGSWLDDKGIDIASIDPATIKLYNHGGNHLSENLNDMPENGWFETPVLMMDGGDGSFDNEDYFLFYGCGTQNTCFSTSGNLEHFTNLYSNENIYFLVFNDGIKGNRIETATSEAVQNPQTVTFFDDLYFFDEDLINPAHVGNSWANFHFSNSTSQFELEPVMTDGLANEEMIFTFRLFPITGITHHFDVYFNNTFLKSYDLYKPSLNPYYYVSLKQIDKFNLAIEDQNSLIFRYGSSNGNGNAYLDWVRIQYKRALNATDNMLKFYSPQDIGDYRFELSNFTEQPSVWDVSDITDIKSISLSSIDSKYVFDAAIQSSPKTYYAFTAEHFITPSQITQDEISTLRNRSNKADYIIITDADFWSQAEQLKGFREIHDHFSVYIADIKNIFDEFGNGMPDPAAIRYFLNYTLTQWQKPSPQYVLLLGDGHYDYRSIQSQGIKNYIIPYEYKGMSNDGQSRATDDFYTYVIGSDSYGDISIGRINCTSADEAGTYIQKVIQYESEPIYGIWKKTVTIVGDDEVTPGRGAEPRHTNDAESISKNNIPEYFDLKKIYLSEYPLEKSVGYDAKPKANEALMDQLNRGTVLVNYVGHGNETVWAHESVFEKSRDLNRLENARRLPLYYAATCAFGLYDDPDEQSFSEELILADSTGGIAVIAASRFSLATYNVDLNKSFLKKLFAVESGTMRLGDALRFAKLSGSTKNNEMYHLFGDPALRLAVPSLKAEITYTDPDSFKALSVFQVQGEVNEPSSFNGNLILNAFDSFKDIAYVSDVNARLNYKLPGNSIFRGEASITESQFDLSFVVPKDISYAGNTGRLSLYFWNASGDGVAWKDNIPVGGSADVVDTGEPTITIAFEDNENFISGDMIEENPVLVASIADDKTGINLTGEIGHTLLLTLNNTTEKDVTEYFQYDENSYLQGKVVYPMQNLSQGQHTLKLKAWDNANNSSSQTVTFEIIPEGRLLLTDVLNYPNPFESETQFTFNLSHTSEIEIKVFTVSGRLIRKLDYLQGDSGFNMIHWDGRDELGDPLANGVYLFKVTAKTELNGESQKVSEIGRALLVR